MKAYQAWNNADPDAGSTVVFAETARIAKNIARSAEVCEDAAFTDVRVVRYPEMDGKDRGRREIDWNDPEDRKALVALGWACLETYWECDTCPQKSQCSRWEAEE